MIDDKVFDKENKNVALTKNDFAVSIFNDDFADVDFEPFLEIAKEIQFILNN